MIRAIIRGSKGQGLWKQEGVSSHMSRVFPSFGAAALGPTVCGALPSAPPLLRVLP